MALLIGDSIFKRLFLRFPDNYHPDSIKSCIGGIKIADLKLLVKGLLPSLKSNTVMLLVGINDLVRPHEFSIVWQNYVSLVNLLVRSKVKLFLVQILPVANYKLNAKCKTSIDRFNFQLLSLQQKPGVTVVSFSSVFLDANNTPISKLYCAKRGSFVDYLHPNVSGLRAINNVLQSFTERLRLSVGPSTV